MLTQGEVLNLLHYNKGTGVFTWRRSRGRKRAGAGAGYVHPDGYRRICINGRSYPEARIAWLYVVGVWPTDYIDHINGVRDDNRFSNLREATVNQNIHNRHFKPGRNLKGANPKGKRWEARVGLNGKRIYLGTFDTAEEANAAYVKAAKRLHGEFYASNGSKQ